MCIKATIVAAAYFAEWRFFSIKPMTPITITTSPTVAARSGADIFSLG
jgi:hypothetical protein